MSQFYDQASLVMVPSGYKAGKVYSQKPLSTDGELSFSRASNATRVNSSGLVERVRTNDILYSQDFSNWSAASCSVSTNTTANPLDGAVNADTITFTGGTTNKYVIQSFSFNGNYTASVYLKAGTNQFVQFLLGSDAAVYVNFDLVNGTRSGAFGSSADIVSVGNGWYRCSMSFTSTIGTHVFISAVDSLSAFRFNTTTSTGTLFAFGYQLETGDIATDYIATTSTAVSVGPVSGLPRLDYSGGASCPSLLLEPQRTNLVTFSESFDNAGWYKANNIAVTANAGISPDGYTNADLLYGASSGTISSVQINLGAASVATYTNSIFVKYSGKQWFYILEMSGNGGGNFFDIQNGVLGAQNYGSGAFITSYGNGWYRIGFSQALTSGNVYAIYGVSNGNNTYVNTASGTDGALIYGAQAEPNASYATSYIGPTLSSAVTRVADYALKVPSISGLYGATATTFFLDFVKKENALGWTITGGNGSQLFSLCQFDASNPTKPRIVFDDGVDTGGTLSAISNGRHKIAVSYATNDTRIYIDGTLVLTDTSCTYYQMDRIAFNATAWTGYTNNTNAFAVNQFLLIPSATSNADLATLTAL
jgi:hypothetical protein